nr:xylulose kinase-1 [Tanacetum cinerariifolium]
MKMEHYLSHTNYPIWKVIQNVNGLVSVITDTNGMIKVLPPKTTKEVAARERDRKARTTLLIALQEDHLAKFHKMANAKDMWEAIKSRFGGNDESKVGCRAGSLPIYLEDIQCAGSDHDHYQEAACAHHEEYVMHDCVQLDHVVDSHDDYTSDSNIILCDQYVKDNEVPVVHSGLSYVPDDAFMMIYDDMCEPHDQPPALYNDHEIIKDNHTPAIVHNSEDTLEIAEITRKKMNDKMNDHECVTRKVKIAPHDYSKENLLATFTPQKQLTPEQIFWSNDLKKLKSKALKERTKVSRPIKAFTVITPTTITDGERGFEQTKACYLQEVIPFLKTLKDNFEGIQKVLTKEVKEMKDVFEELEAEVAQYAVDRKYDAIELKNILIANDNLIDECLSQEVFCVATNSELNVARFTEMHVGNTTAETRCLALEAKLANLHCDPLALETKATPVEESTGVLESFLRVRRILFFFVLSLDCDPLALETKATPVEESTSVLESMFGEGVKATRFVPRLVILGQLGTSGTTSTYSSAGSIGFKDTALRSTALPLSCSLRAVINKTFS